jgi:hypothetical protein
MEWHPIETIPIDTRVLLWVDDSRILLNGVRVTGAGYGVRFGRAYQYEKTVEVKPEGSNGNWTSNCKAWMPLPPPPKCAECA